MISSRARLCDEEGRIGRRHREQGLRLRELRHRLPDAVLRQSQVLLDFIEVLLKDGRESEVAVLQRLRQPLLARLDPAVARIDMGTSELVAGRVTVAHKVYPRGPQIETG